MLWIILCFLFSSLQNSINIRTEQGPCLRIRLWTLRHHRDGGKVGRKQCPSGSCVRGGLLFFATFQWCVPVSVCVKCSCQSGFAWLYLTLLCIHPIPLQRSSPRSPHSPHSRQESCKVSRSFGSRADGRGGSQAEPEHQSERVLLNINEVKVRDQLFFSLLFSLSLFFLFSLPKIVSKTLIRATKVQEIQHLHQIICRCKS